jgi:hypothetical protein
VGQSENDLHSEWADALLWLFAVRNTGECVGVGNAFVVSAQGPNALVLTAQHNVAALDRLAAQGSPFKTLTEARIAAPHFESKLHRVLAIRPRHAIESVSMFAGFSGPDSKDFDVAMGVAQSEVSNRESFKLAFPMKLIAPDIGTPVLACGWSGFKKEYERIEDLSEWRFSAQRTTVAGTVVGSYLRKPGVAPGPCFEMNGDFPPGLSGSPVVCDVGGVPHACGVVSSGMDADGRATAAMIWPALALSLSLDTGSGESSGVNLHELARRGIVNVARGELEHFSVRGLTVEYVPTPLTR